MLRIAPAALALLIPTSTAFGQTEESAPTSFQEALMGGRTWIHLNFRVEHAAQDALPKDANAATLRTALGYETAPFRGLRGLIEFEDISNIGNELYDSTTNGIMGRPVVADPDTTEINQIYASYEATEDLRARLGRQEIIYGNHRFIGSVAWRQNHQSFDAGRVDWESPSGTKFSYAYVDKVQRIFGDDSPKGQEQMSSHLLDVRHSLEGAGELAAYGYFLDFDRSEKLSSMTVGARYSGSSALNDEFDLVYTGEYAMQEDAGHNPIEVDQDYWLAEVGVAFDGIKIRVGNEHLGGSGAEGDKFSTPLATLHKFNGFADLFLTTPDTGLEDRYLTVSGKVGEVTCAATYHIFESDSGGIDYGKEIDFTALMPVTDRIKVGAKLAHFTSDDAFTDTDRAMAWVTYQLR